MSQPVPTVALGGTGIQITPLGIGAWAWGDRMFWGYGQNYGQSQVRGAFDAVLEAGVNWFDTAETYGQGCSERLLGQFLKDSSSQALVATKFFPFPWRLTRASLLRALRGSLERLQLERVDLYQIHWPIPPVPVETWAHALADAVEAGLARAVGVSNFSESQMRRAHHVLSQRGVPLASNQVEYHLLDRRVERNGVLKTCRELNVSLIAYSPLGQGLLTGKYSPESPPSGTRGWKFNRRTLERTQQVVKVMEAIGQAHGGKTPAQVALNWVMCKGGLPIPGAKDSRQARENTGALGWQLDQDEVARLDQATEF